MLLLAAGVVGINCSPTPIGPSASPKTLHRIGFLTLGPKPDLPFDFPEVVEGLHDLGYVEDDDFVFEQRHAGNDLNLLPGLAAELVESKVELIVAATVPAIRAAKDATSQIPIVMLPSSSDPVRDGLVGSLAKPGGNVTGMAGAPPEIEIKRLELLVSAVPGISRVLVLGWWDVLDVAEWQAAAERLGVQLLRPPVTSAADVRTAFAAGLEERPGGVVVIQRAFLSGQALPVIAELTATNRLPAIAPFRLFPEHGGLLSYEPRSSEAYRRPAYYVDRILRGDKPADLPVETPRRYDLVVNRKTERGIGLTLPADLLAQADDQIQ